MRALKRIREVPSRLDGSFESLLSQFSSTTLELSPSLGTPEFARQLTARAATPSVELNAMPAGQILGRDLAEALGWGELVTARLTGSEGELLGLLCLVDLTRELSPAEWQLLEALVSHASVALENVRLFSRIEQSRKQWVEDFDAISDFIVVHDAENRVLRLNRALADVLGVRPSVAVGRDMGKLDFLEAAPLPGECPFCRNAKAAREEFTHTAGERTFLVSSSRIHAVLSKRLPGSGFELRVCFPVSNPPAKGL
jgi:PAS domain-containing protein